MNDVVFSPITHPSAWRAADVGEPHVWTRTLNAAELDAFRAVARALRQRPNPSPVHLIPQLLANSAAASLMSLIAGELETGRGFVLLRGFPVAERAADDIRLMCLTLCSGLGTVAPQTPGGELIGYVRDATRPHDGLDTERGYRSRSAIGGHCDPADIVGLLCVRQARRGGTSTIASSAAMFNVLIAERPDYLETLTRGFGHAWPGAEPDSVRTPVFSSPRGRLRCRFHPWAIRRWHAATGAPLSRAEDDALTYFEQLSQRADLRLDMNLEPGDLQLLDNDVIVHGRTAYDDFDEAPRKRLLLRVWVNRTPPCAASDAPQPTA